MPPPTRAADTEQVPPIASARPYLDLAGLLTVLAYTMLITFGSISVLLIEDQSTGDFFLDASSFVLFGISMPILGVLMALMSRVFFRWGGDAREGVAASTGVIAVVVGVGSIFIGGGGLVVQFARAADDEYSDNLADALLFTYPVLAAAALTLLAGLLLTQALRPRARRPPPVPIG